MARGRRLRAPQSRVAAHGRAQRAHARRLDRHRRGRAHPLHGRLPLGRGRRDRALPEARAARRGARATTRAGTSRPTTSACSLRRRGRDADPRRVGRADVGHVHLGGRPRRRGRDHGQRTRSSASTTRAGRRRSTTGTARSLLTSIKEPDTLRRGGRDGRLGSQHRLAAARRPTRLPTPSLAYAEARSRCPVARVDGVLGGFWAVLGHDLLVEAALDYGTFQQRRPVLQHAPPAARVRPARAHRLPAAAQPLLRARAAGGARGAAPALRGRDDRPARRCRTRRLREAFSHPFPTRALCLLLALPDGDWRLINDWSRRVDEVGGQSPPGKPGADRRGRGAPAVHDRADRGAAPQPRRRRRQRARLRRSGAAAARRRAAGRDRDDVHLRRAQHDDERDRKQRPPARPRPRAAGARPCRARADPGVRRGGRAARRAAAGDAPVATADTELGGRKIAAGEFVWLVFGSANLELGATRARPRPARSRTATSASAAGSTSASARRSRASRSGSRSRSCSRAPRRSRSTARSRARRGRGSASTGSRFVSVVSRGSFRLSGGLTLSYLRWGEPGAPDLLLLHGGGLSATTGRRWRRGSRPPAGA